MPQILISFFNVYANPISSGSLLLAKDLSRNKALYIFPSRFPENQSRENRNRTLISGNFFYRHEPLNRVSPSLVFLLYFVLNFV